MIQRIELNYPGEYFGTGSRKQGGIVSRVGKTKTRTNKIRD